MFSLVADLIYLWRGNPIWENHMAFYTLLAGIIGAAAAAVPGLIDWATLTDRAAVRSCKLACESEHHRAADFHREVSICGPRAELRGSSTCRCYRLFFLASVS